MSECTWRWIGLGASAVIVLGSVLPWATVSTPFGSISAAGTEGDGVITLILGVIAVVGFAVQRFRLASIPAGLALATGVFDLVNVSRTIGDVDSEFARASVGYGLWLVVAGGVVAVLAASVPKRRPARAARPRPGRCRTFGDAQPGGNHRRAESPITRVVF